MAKKILIIEDQAPMRRNLALMLQMEGYETCTAENGRVGLETAYLYTVIWNSLHRGTAAGVPFWWLDASVLARGVVC